MSNTGCIKWFDTKKGYGFVTDCSTNEDFFVHHTNIKLQKECWKTLYPGEYVAFDLDEVEGKTHAVNVTGVMGGLLFCESRYVISQKRKEYKSSTTVSGDVPVSDETVSGDVSV